jgi:ATP-dependent exoDNAse (exonuclease V) beta subunit
MIHLSGQTKEIKTLGLGGKFKTNTSNQITPGVKGVYPELLLSRISEDGKLRLAGQADLIIVDGLDVYVLDYKTNRSIDMKAYYDRRNKKHSTLKYPLNNIQDSNFWHYTLQLSTYAWMIQKISPEFNIKLLMLIHHDHEGNVNTYECEYRKNDVERMLAFYKKELEHEEFKKSLEKMTF